MYCSNGGIQWRTYYCQFGCYTLYLSLIFVASPLIKAQLRRATEKILLLKLFLLNPQ